MADRLVIVATRRTPIGSFQGMFSQVSATALGAVMSVMLAYRRRFTAEGVYLEKGFRDAFDLSGNPVRLTLRSGSNPFAGRRNVLTERQQRRRKRVIAHRRKR